MRKRKASLVCVYSLLLLSTAVIGAGAVLRHEPSFYRNRRVDAGVERKRLSTKCMVDLAQLLLNIRQGGEPKWHLDLQESEINSFFQEDYVTAGEVESLRKLGISEPRVAFDKDCIRFAFRYGRGFWSTVVSYDLRVWAVPKEPNVLAVEIRGRRVGALPVSSHALLNELITIGASHNIEVTAYRHEGNPVALIRFLADQSNPSAQLKCLHIESGRLLAGGICTGGHAAPAKGAVIPAVH